MVYFTSNLAIDGLLASIFIGSSLRNKFLHSNWTKALFLLANLFAIIPDFDVFVGLLLGIKDHRGQSHSIIFPLVFIVIGMILLLVNHIRSKNITSSLHDVDALFSSEGNTKGQILYLLPYFFILLSFYWGMHIILDMDSAEGPMMLLWPFDNTLYQIFLNFKFSPYPFLILPWTPLGVSFAVQQSGISGLFGYLFNWTPQQLINYYQAPTFEYMFVGGVLNVLLVVIWLFFVVKPFWPLEGMNVGQKLNVFSFFTKLHSYWKKISKELLVPGIILILIGFTLGPLISPQVSQSQPLQDNLNFTKSTFNGLSFIPIDAINQPLDPNSEFSISINYNLTNVRLGDSIYFVVAPESLFLNIGNNISNTISTFNSLPNQTNDTIFKHDYINNVDSLISNQSTIFYQVQKSNQTNFSYSTHLLTKNSYGMGFVLQNWISTLNINQTNTQLFISGNYSINYTRDVNYWVGTAIEVIGIGFVLIALALPFRKKNKHV